MIISKLLAPRRFDATFSLPNPFAGEK